jgi:hypothetical protein
MSAEREPPKLRQQDDQVSGGRVLLGGLVVLAISAVMVVWAWAATGSIEASLRPSLDFPEQRLGPRRAVQAINQALFSEEPGAGERLNARKRRALDAYRWLDPERRIVTLPIDQAMDRLARESTR